VSLPFLRNPWFSSFINDLDSPIFRFKVLRTLHLKGNFCINPVGCLSYHFFHIFVKPCLSSKRGVDSPFYFKRKGEFILGYSCMQEFGVACMYFGGYVCCS